MPRARTFNSLRRGFIPKALLREMPWGILWGVRWGVQWTVLCALLPISALAQASIVNFISYSPTFASSGQPTPEQIIEVSNAGYERVIYLALTDHDTSVPNEDRLVRDAGMAFVQIPVVWAKPTPRDFEHFAAIMNAGSVRKTLVHCQINLRASAFSFLYRVIHQGVPVEEAKEDLNTIWAPHPHWRDFIFEVLDAHGIDPECDICDWSTAEPA